jgi:hypothetical protein
MLRVLVAGLMGGVVLVVWSTLFSVLGPAESRRADLAHASSVAQSLGHRVAEFGHGLSLGPSAAMAGRADSGSASVDESAAGSFDGAAIARGLGVACTAGVFAAVLMSLYGGNRRSFAERVLFAVLLGGFAGSSMMVPAGGWTDFSLSRSAPLLGEVLIGWLLAGMVIAVMLNPNPRRRLAKA